MRLLTITFLLVLAVAAPASAGLSGPPKYIPVADGVIEHRVWETVIESDGRPREEPSSRTRREGWVASDRDRMVVTDLDGGGVVQQLGKEGGQLWNFYTSVNRLTIYPSSPGRASLMSRATEGWIAREELAAGLVRVDAEVAWNGRRALRLVETDAVHGDREGAGYRIVDAESYELLETSFVSADGGYKSTRRLVASEVLPRAGNERLLTRPEFPGAKVERHGSTDASAAKRKAKAKARRKGAAKQRRAR